MNATDHPTDGSDEVVSVSLPGDDRVVDHDLRRFEQVTRFLRFACSTGDRFGGEWRGVPVATLLESTTLPDETTHLLVEGEDGFRACVPVRAALDGLLVVGGDDEDGDGHDGEDDEDGDGHDSEDDEDGDGRDTPRFVSPGVDGTRTVQRVTGLEPLALDPGESPDDYETV